MADVFDQLGFVPEAKPSSQTNDPFVAMGFVPESNPGNKSNGNFISALENQPGNKVVSWIMRNAPSFMGSTTEGMSRRAIGAGRGFTDIGEGWKQKYLQGQEMLGLGTPGQSDQYQNQVDAERAFYNNKMATPDADLFRTGANNAPYLLIPGGVEGNLLTRMGTGALAGAGIGFSQYVPKGGSGLLNTAVGAGVGAGIPLLLAGISKGLNAAYGDVGTPEQQAVINYGQKYNVPVYAGDVSKNPFVKGATYSLENMPPIPGFSMVPERANQMESAGKAAQNVTNDLYQKMVNTPYGGLTGMAKIEAAAANPSNPQYKASQALLTKIANTGNDWNDILQTSQQTKLLREKLIADQKYNKVAQIADKYGPVPKTNSLNVIDDAIDNASQGLVPNTQTINQLKQIKENLQNKDFTYSQMRQARGQIGSLINDYYKGANAAIGEQGVGSLQMVKDALGKDLDEFAQAHGPALTTVWKNADNFYRNALAPAKDRALAASITTGTPDQIYDKWIKQGAYQDRATQFYNSLDDKGKAAVRYGMVNNALNEATKDQEKFSPGRFSSELKKISGAQGVFFQGQDKAELDGFTNLMNHISGGYKAISKPDTGARTIPLLYGASALGSGLLYGLPAFLGSLGGVVGLQKLMTTDAGRNFLLASSKLKAGSPAMQSLVNKISQVIQRGATVKATKAAANQ